MKQAIPKSKLDFSATWRNAHEAFLDIKSKLMENPDYRGLYVAVRDGIVIDKDKDDIRLVERVAEAFSGENLYIGRVSLKSPSAVELPSPEVR